MAGLTTAEARARLAQDGPNALVPKGRSIPPALHALGKAIVDPMALLLLAAIPIYVLLGDVTDAIVTAIALVPVIGVGVALEVRAERALDALARLTSPSASVVRDEVEATVPIEEVVRGDLLVLREGDVVPADAALAPGARLVVDESSLTGESVPVDKEDDRAVYAGTTVLSGRAHATVAETGPATRLGRIGGLVGALKVTETPLQQLTDRLVRRLAIVAVGVCAAVVGLQIVAGTPVGEALLAGISLAIAAVPEEFPMVFTLYLGLGAWRLARRRALVRQLPGVETLGSTTVICTDKTGTLTLGRLDVVALVVGSEVLPAADAGDTDTARDLLVTAVRASEPDPFDPLDRAIVATARHADVDVDALHAAPLLRDHPFDPVRKIVTHVWDTPEGPRTATKGTIEAVSALCAPDSLPPALQALHEGLAAQGMRLVAVAEGPAPRHGTRADDEAALRWVGLVGFADPLRPGVQEALTACGAAGIRVMMITGDHPVTAHAVAQALGLPHDDATGIVTGDQLDATDDAALDALVGHAAIFARTRPEQKHRIVASLRRQGHVVAMTGDGVNDAPALREADIGVAMGQRGTEVARQAATIVLLDDDFSTLVDAVREGRRIFRTLRQSFRYLVGFHVPLVLAALVMPLLGEPLLLLPIHLILLELVVHPTVALVFEADPAPDDLMRRPPRPRDQGLLERSAWRTVAVGLALAAASIGVFLFGLARGDVAHARAMGFATMVLGQTLLVLVELSPDRPTWRSLGRGNRTLAPVLGGTVAMLVAGTSVPAVATWLHVVPLGVVDWLACAGLAAASTLLLEPFKRPASDASA